MTINMQSAPPTCSGIEAVLNTWKQRSATMSGNSCPAGKAMPAGSLSLAAYDILTGALEQLSLCQGFSQRLSHIRVS